MSLLNHPRPSGKLARWALTVQELDLVIKYRAGKSNSNADALSRNPVSTSKSDCVCSVEVKESNDPSKSDCVCSVEVKESNDPSKSDCVCCVEKRSLLTPLKFHMCVLVK